MNIHRLAVAIAGLEGKKESVNIAQIKEVLKCLGAILHRMDSDELAEVLNKLLKPIGKAKLGRRRAR